MTWSSFSVVVSRAPDSWGSDGLLMVSTLARRTISLRGDTADEEARQGERVAV